MCLCVFVCVCVCLCVQIQHPFALKSANTTNGTQKTTAAADQIVADIVLQQLKPVEEKFPVSSGINHKNEVSIALPTPVAEVS